MTDVELCAECQCSNEAKLLNLFPTEMTCASTSKEMCLRAETLRPVMY